ncbi:hypothetical protein CSA56_08450 [candidate division KSB3 bacterium]|uniref:Uncharacterized protein n=1 Tax=candidate division KSB3 bacterium TaxID=2044937 RepID=A0A2G6KEQ1_9BACT|nr:MAG: hypothetical protein CSA56_08450 [candidate division KSB3 bacterium]
MLIQTPQPFDTIFSVLFFPDKHRLHTGRLALVRKHIGCIVSPFSSCLNSRNGSENVAMASDTEIVRNPSGFWGSSTYGGRRGALC